MPKLERLKLAARRLSNINHLGEVGVRRLERKLENSSGSRMRRSGVSVSAASSMSLDYDPSSMSLDCRPGLTPLDKPPTSEGTMTAEASGDTVLPPAVSGDYDPSAMSLDCHPSPTPLDKPPTSEGAMTAEASGNTMLPPAVSGD
jgi:hypothetical protein